MSTISLSQVRTLSNKLLLDQTGSIIQTKYVRSDAFTAYFANNAGDGNPMYDLSLEITPISPNSRLIMYWNICGETNDTNSVFVIQRDNILITRGGEEGRNSVSNNRWVGYAGMPYDNNDYASTPNNMFIIYSQISGSTSARTYTPAVRSSGPGTSTFFLNRTVSSTGQDSYENAVSTGVIYEVAQ